MNGNVPGEIPITDFVQQLMITMIGLTNNSEICFGIFRIFWFGLGTLRSILPSNANGIFRYR